MVDKIESALSEAQVRVADLEKQRSELEVALRLAREEQQLLQRVLAIRRGEGVAQPAIAQTSQLTNGHPGQPAVAAVVAELEVNGRPMHISDLMRLLREKEISIPGAGTQANLISHLRRDAKLVRPSRGMYALAAWGLENMAATAKRKRRVSRRLPSKTIERIRP